MKSFKSASTYLSELPIRKKGEPVKYRTNENQNLPEVSMTAKRPEMTMSKVVKSAPSMKSGVSGWSYHEGQKKWISTVHRDKKTGKPLILSDDDYQKRYPGQLR